VLTTYQVAQAQSLRLKGASYQEIGRLLGVAHTTVSRSLG
jgi:hypothetical protein